MYYINNINCDLHVRQSGFMSNNIFVDYENKYFEHLMNV